MSYLLDTSVAIHLRDRTAIVRDRIAVLGTTLFLSAVSRVELEGGVHAVPDLRPARQAKLDVILETLKIIDFTDEMAAAYGTIVANLGFSRRKIIDRMIAATALVADLPIITINGDDFADIDQLKLEVWSA